MVFKNEQVSKAETEKILELLCDCLSRRVLGDAVELGCYEGDTSLCLAEVLRDYAKEREKAFKMATFHEKSVENHPEAVENFPKLWIYDSFEGLPEKTSEDDSELGRDFRKGALLTSKSDLKKRFLKAGLAVPTIKKAWFSDLTPSDLPEQICFAFLDGDLYQSIAVSLELVSPLLASGSIIVIHDYNNPALPGVARATDEWLLCRNLRTQIFESMMIIWC